MFSHLKSNLTRRRDPRSHLDLANPSVELTDTSYASFQRAEEGRRSSTAKTPIGVDGKDADESWSLVGRENAMPEEREATRLGSSWWRREMLVDRSLTGMAALTSLFAVIMLIVCISASPEFSHQLEKNPNSTSIAFHKGHCKSVEPGYQALKFLINVASTMILGMSNTYQQLATALRVEDLAYMLSKHGDCRVGTNSPFAINYKRTDRLKSWLSWLLLIMTSMPIHLLANSLVDFEQWYEDYYFSTTDYYHSYGTYSDSALILTGCLLAKAIYMALTMYSARGKVKSHLLNFGDVLVVSSMYPRLQVQGECMTSKGDFHRRQIKHTCHKHCRDPDPSDTGEELGHCQKCKKFNVVYNHTKLPWPTLAMKRKRAFLGTLGQTALTQILILCLLSIGSLTWSIMLGLVVGSEWHSIYTGKHAATPHVSLVAYLSKGSQLAELPANRISSEIASYFISNGLQFVYSTIYLLLIYNLTLISMEFDWGKLEKYGGRLRSTIVKDPHFNQSYLLQLPKRVLIPTMTYSIIMHWLLGLSMQTAEVIFETPYRSFSQYTVMRRTAQV
ncbi:hypothetical protein UCDDS831_g02972 [Diplodia seriata]|uniref:DUF6536 domain-containing protein n=1 Tax=Diplodia seriata TaxID=420778 RepID=A0A0G2EM52_9PEZI|nr:hypothetical protein UCDDS831_g02972 [Diplodia seriata]